MMPWRFRQPLARVRRVVDGANTLYLCSPRGEQRALRAAFRGALRMVLEQQQRRVDSGIASAGSCWSSTRRPRWRRSTSLDQMAATVSGLDVTLVTVVQDFAQLRLGGDPGPRRSSTTTRRALVLGGLADPTVSKYLPEVNDFKEGGSAVQPIRQRAGGTGYGRRRKEAGLRCSTRRHGGVSVGCVAVEHADAHYDLTMTPVEDSVFGQILAIDIGATNIKFCHVDCQGTLLECVRRKPTPYPCSPERLIELLSERIVGSKVEWVGVGFPGEFDEGHVIRPGNLSRPGGVTTEKDPGLDARWRGLRAPERAARHDASRRPGDQRCQTGGSRLLRRRGRRVGAYPRHGSRAGPQRRRRSCRGPVTSAPSRSRMATPTTARR